MRVFSLSVLLRSAVLFWGTLTTGLMLLSGSAIAQVTPDGSLSTTVTQSGNDFTIDSGNRTGNNLFHSFDQFSVPTGGAAIFNNTVDVQNIFGRVTGGSLSNIDGLIRANGPANLFLLNPSGILFGQNASLSIGGSFIGTTANSIQFDDGVEFSAVNVNGSPLLTMSVPTGLQMGTNPGAITVQGPAAPSAFFRPPTLAVAANQTLALVGEQITVDSANVLAPDGRIELWAVQNGQIAINSQTPWQLASSAATTNWGNITLQNLSLVDASGIDGGAINIRGRGLTLQDGSNITSQTFAGHGKGITVNTTDFVDLLSNPTAMPGFEGISTSVGRVMGLLVLPGPPSTGQAGDVTIATERLRMTNSAWLQSAAAGNNSRAGDVSVRATDVDLAGYEALPGFVGSVISSSILAGSNNQGGQVTVEAKRIHLLNGSRISSSVIGGNGQASRVSIQATESFDIRGSTSILGISSAVLASLEAGSTGQGGYITIDAGNLTLSQGGAITSEVAGTRMSFFDSSILPGAQGTAGNIDIRARNINVSDPIIDGYSRTLTGITASLGSGAVGTGGNINLTADNLRVFNGGQITSSSQGQGTAGNVNLNVRNIELQGISSSLVNDQYLPSAITASSAGDFDAGSVNIAADTVNVRDAAQISVSNTGAGNAGNLNVSSRSLFLDNGASLQANVNGGSQGNINLQASELLMLRHGSNINTNALGTSMGGNITINAPILVGLENSDIVANATRGQGGNINITTQGILGLRYRDHLTADNDITASSDFGINGTVQVNNIGVDPDSGLAHLPANLTDSSQQITQGCAANQGSSFVATGRGGLPLNPTQQVRIDLPWSDIRDLAAYSQPPVIQTATAAVMAAPLIQATGWQQNAHGQVELLASTNASAVTIPSVATCSAAT